MIENKKYHMMFKGKKTERKKEEENDWILYGDFNMLKNALFVFVIKNI